MGCEGCENTILYIPVVAGAEEVAELYSHI